MYCIPEGVFGEMPRSFRLKKQNLSNEISNWGPINELAMLRMQFDEM